MRVAALAASLAALTLGGCGESDHLNTAQAERTIEQGLERETGAPVVKVECPENVTLRAGDSFECTATSGEEEATVVVRQLDDSGRVEWRVR